MNKHRDFDPETIADYQHEDYHAGYNRGFCFGITLAIAIATLLLFFNGITIRAQDDSCHFPLPLTGIDITRDYYEAARNGQRVGITQRVYGYTSVTSYHTEYPSFQAMQVRLDGQELEFIGLFDVYDYWTLIWRTEFGYRLIAGDDWTVGDDFQLHSPSCYFYADQVSAVKLFQFPRLNIYDVFFPLSLHMP